MNRHREKAVGMPLRRGGDPFGYGGKPRSVVGGPLSGGQSGTDVVPAMLTPREAVLNRNGAELMGRGAIRAANVKGNVLAASGVDLPSLKYKHYARGTEDAVEPIGYNDLLGPERQWGSGGEEIKQPDLGKLSAAKQRQAMFSPEVLKTLLGAAQSAGLFGGGDGPVDPGIASGGFAQGAEEVGASEPWRSSVDPLGMPSQGMSQLQPLQPLPPSKVPGYAMGVEDMPPYPPELAGAGLEYHGDGGGWYGPELDVEDDYTRWTTPLAASHENAPWEGKEILRLAGGHEEIGGIDLPPIGAGPADIGLPVDVQLQQYQAPSEGGKMGYYDPGYGYGGGGPTQNVIGLLSNLAGNAVVPGAGLVTGPLGRMFTRMVQRSGGVEDPMSGGGGPSGSSTGDVRALRGPSIHYSQGGLPPPGGWGGLYGQGSAGDLGVSSSPSNYDYWGRMGLQRLLQGRDPSGGMQGLGNFGQNNFQGRQLAPMLPVGSWGGTGLGTLGTTFGTGAVNPDFKERSAK